VRNQVWESPKPYEFGTIGKNWDDVGWSAGRADAASQPDPTISETYRLALVRAGSGQGAFQDHATRTEDRLRISSVENPHTLGGKPLQSVTRSYHRRLIARRKWPAPYLNDQSLLRSRSYRLCRHLAVTEEGCLCFLWNCETC
jgi:hypothetical protein